MKRIIILGFLFVIVIACKDNTNNNNNEQNYSDLTPLEVVNKRMNYFNEHNYDAFIKLYNTNVEVYTYPDRLMGTGSDRLASIFKSDFENKTRICKDCQSDGKRTLCDQS